MSPRHEMSYDPACEDLAEHFLSGLDTNQKLVAELSQHIQDAVESWITGEAERIDALRAAQLRYRRPPGECSFCDAHRNDSMMPPHTASDRCESGKHPHCTCDACF